MSPATASAVSGMRFGTEEAKMTRIFAILFGLMALTACESGGLYASTSGDNYESSSY